jgi:Cu+-exporting ATPase
MAKDPVCGMYVEENENALKVTVRGTTYYFCSQTCMNTFLQPEKEMRNTKFLVILSFFLGIPIFILSYTSFLNTNLNNLIQFILATPVQFIAGGRFYRGFYHSLRARSANMDTLIATGTSAAYFYSALVTFQVYLPLPKFPEATYYDASTLIIAFILTGKYFEYIIKGKASDAVRKLMDLQPRMAHISKDGSEMDVPVENIEVGNVMMIKPGERIPTDGVVLEGYSSVDEKMITGESVPIEKKKGDQVIGATINKTGVLKVKATKIGTDTTLAQIVKLVEEAQIARAPIERLVDIVASYFVPLVVSVALISFLGWYLLLGRSFAFSFSTLIAVLVIACPCALGLATPAAIVVGTGKGAEQGILIKGGEYLENAYKLKTVVFDKTGTLTEGKLEVTDIISIATYTAGEILFLSASVESNSEHPLGEALVRKAKEEGIKFADVYGFEALPGLGIRAEVEGKEIVLGNKKLFEQMNIELGPMQDKFNDLVNEGKTAMIVSSGRQIIGVIGFSDVLKKEAEEAIKMLKDKGLEVIMLTGDNKRTADAIAKRLGIEKVIAEVLPKDKVNVIRELRKEGKIVAMVGDGINDAPALAEADIGIAIGSGTDVAIETGGIILIKDDLRDVPHAIQLSRKTMSKIRQNLFWAFIYNIGLIPIAALGFLNPILAGLAMGLSSVTVVTNSLTLRKMKFE